MVVMLLGKDKKKTLNSGSCIVKESFNFLGRCFFEWI